MPRRPDEARLHARVAALGAVERSGRARPFVPTDSYVDALRRRSAARCCRVAPARRGARGRGRAARARSRVGSYGSLQCGQSMRTRRCARMPMTLERTRNGSISISTRRVTAPAASLVWMVESTRWPVSDAWIAISAVSLSRISPTMMTSGSWRRKARSALAKVSPIFGLHVHLVDAADLVLDRILGGEDVAGSAR